MKAIVCSDFDFGNHFKHMSSKDVFKYEEKQIESFNRFVSKCIEIEPEIIFIVGNLFGSSKPRNLAIETVRKGLNELADNGMKILILPGAHDVPLPFTNDIPVHYVFENKNIKFLFTRENTVKLSIEKPIKQMTVGDLRFNIFTMTSPLRNPTDIEFDLEIDKDSLNLFLLSDVTSFKKNIEKIFVELLKKLDRFEFDAVLLGGNYPDVPEISKCGFDIIYCPQIHKNNFLFTQKYHGIKIIEIKNGMINDTDQIFPISKFNVKNENLDVSGLNSKEINDKIYDIIKKNSDPVNNIMRLTLVGKLEKQKYHNLKLFQRSEMGKRSNYYFELFDRIEFVNSSQEIQGLNVKEELEDFISKKKTSEPQKIIAEELKFDIDDVYKECLDLIKNNWEREA
ncbi:MAG: hypothetical protein GF311_09710 [Candidatus Lokiarchaeota archaeon]|nr:hypothetical protein [Candidatus Lokiarchaeota archaeon]